MTWYILARMPYFRRPGHILCSAMPNQFCLVVIKKILSQFRGDFLGKGAPNLNDPHVQYSNIYNSYTTSSYLKVHWNENFVFRISKNRVVFLVIELL